MKFNIDKVVNIPYILVVNRCLNSPLLTKEVAVAVVALVPGMALPAVVAVEVVLVQMVASEAVGVVLVLGPVWKSQELELLWLAVKMMLVLKSQESGPPW